MLQQLLTPAIFAVFAIGFAVIWTNNKEMKAAGILGLAYGAAGFGFLVENIVIKTNDYMVLRAVGDIGYILSSLFLVLGVLSRFRIRPPIALLAYVSCFTTLVTMWFWFVDDNLQIRTETISYGCAAMSIMGAVICYPKTQTKLDRFLVFLLAMSGAQFVLNSVIVLHVMGETITYLNFSESTFLEVLNFTVAVISLALAVVLFVSLGMDVMKKLRKESDTDPLTGLNNRRSLEALIQTQIETYGTRQPMALIVCDIDHFKSINDNFGHAAGDKVIQCIANILQRNAGVDDIIGRIGGEEFVMFLPYSNTAKARLMAESVRTNFGNQRWPTLQSNLTITSSFGVTMYEPGETYASMFRRADAALYDAKNSGRNKVAIVRPAEIREESLNLPIALNT